jgi:hypothetical protein
MKKSLLTAVALVSLMTSVASANTNAKWTDCGGLSGTTSTCSILSPVRSLILSWLAPSTGATAVVGYNIRATHASTSGVRPCWWDFNPLGPRAAGFAFSGTDNPASCINFLGAFGSPNTAGGWQDLGSPRGRFNIAVANPVGQSGDATAFAGTEFYAATIQIKATGTSASCLGCADGASIQVNDIVLVQEGGQANIVLNTPASTNSSCGTWQATGVCDAVTPTRNKTWGSVKELYR